jgi:integrase
VVIKTDCRFTLHDIRRTFLTTAEKLGLPYIVLKKLANHSGRNDTTFGYIVVDVERLREPMQKIADHLLSIMTQSGGLHRG